MERKICHSFGVMILGSVLAWTTGCADTGDHYSVERQTVNGLPTVTATETSKSQAKVEAIDYENRSIALTGTNGKTEMFTVSRDVRNFSQIKKGDTVSVEYASRIFASVNKSGDMPTTTVVDRVQTAELGEKPGILCSRHAVVESTVESIDLTTRVVKLKNTSGEIITLTADKKLKDLDKVHVGDKVVFDYVEAISINVN